MPLTFKRLKDELICQPLFLLRRELYVRQSRCSALDAGLTGMPSARATLGLAGLAGVRSQKVGAESGVERLLGMLHDVEERRRVAEYLVVVRTRLVLEQAKYLLLVLVAVVLTGQAEPELAVAVREPVVADAVEERISLVDLLFLRQQLMIAAGIADHEHRGPFSDVQPPSYVVVNLRQ